MGAFSSIGGSIFQLVTGQDPNALANQLSAGEQQLTLAVQAIIALLALIVLGQIFIVYELRRK